jgi:hypothetical protein
MFTGVNASFDTSGLFLSDQNALSEWLDSGGRLWMIGQNIGEETDSDADFDSTHLGRSRLYHGYLGLRYDIGGIYNGAAPKPTADGLGPFVDLHVDLSPGADGAGNQTSIEGESALGDTDTYNAANTMVKLFAPRGGKSPQSGIAFGRSSEPSLEESRLQFNYRSAAFGFGLEGVNATTGSSTPVAVTQRTLAWLLDVVGVTLNPSAPSPGGGAGNTRLSAVATSSKSAITQYRWDFGDGSPVLITTTPFVDHHYASKANRLVRVEATDALGHRAVTSRTVSTG